MLVQHIQSLGGSLAPQPTHTEIELSALFFNYKEFRKKGVACPSQTVHCVNTKLWFLMSVVVLDENEPWAPVGELFRKD